MKVIVLCESSAVVRDAFRARGHDAYSCDLLPCDGDPRWHIQADARDVMLRGWDLGIMHPPCTDLAVSGARHFAAKIADGRQQAAIDFARALWNAPIDRIALENPIGILSRHIRKPDQIIQPWQFGHPEQKATCLWLRGLMPLRDTANVYNEMMALPRRERESPLSSADCGQVEVAQRNL